MAIKHAFTSSKADGADTTLIRPTNWNDGHIIDPGSISTPDIGDFAVAFTKLAQASGNPSSIAGLAADARGMEYLGGVEIATAAASTGIVTVPARDMLFIMGRIPGTNVATIPAFRFGPVAGGGTTTDSGANYWHRNLQSLAGFAVFQNAQAASATGMNVFYDAQTGFRSFFLIIANRASQSKPAGFMTALATATAATVGNLTFGGGEWVNTSQQITLIEMITSGGISPTFNAETGIGVFGKNFP